MKRIAILASGSGTNAEAIARYFADRPDVEISMMICDRAEAGVYARMEALDIPTHYIPRPEWRDAIGAEQIVSLLTESQIDLVVLAGFLSMVPAAVLKAFEGRIVNIHPSLLPRHGGKGMWGHHVHESVLTAGDAVSGITIHLVTEVVDGGRILFQASCPVYPDDTPDSLAQRIHPLEHRYFPAAIDELLRHI